jgi:hypothetical protein
VLRRTQDPLKRVIVFDYRIITFFDVSFQILRLTITFVTPYRVSYNPNKQACWFGLFPFRSPLLRESIFLSLPPGTKMFQFSGYAFNMLCIHMLITRHDSCWVSPFGNLWIKAYLQLPKAYRR